MYFNITNKFYRMPKWFSHSKICTNYQKCNISFKLWNTDIYYGRKKVVIIGGKEPAGKKWQEQGFLAVYFLWEDGISPIEYFESDTYKNQ